MKWRRVETEANPTTSPRWSATQAAPSGPVRVIDARHQSTAAVSAAAGDRHGATPVMSRSASATTGAVSAGVASRILVSLSRTASRCHARGNAPSRPTVGAVAEQLSDDEVARFVAGWWGGRATVPVLLGAGEWSRAWALRLDGRAVVVRFGQHRDDFDRDALVGRLAPVGVPVPRVLEVGAAPRGWFAVSERRYGGFLDALDGPGMRAVLPAVFRVLDAMAAAPLPDAPGWGSLAADGGAPSATWAEALLSVEQDEPRLGDWRAALSASEVGTRSFEAGMAGLRGVAPRLPSVRGLVHSDLLNRNVLVEGSQVTAVLDWGCAMAGDPLYDAAWLLYWWPWYPAWDTIDIAAELTRHQQALPGGVPADAGLRLWAYQLHIGLGHLAYTARTGRAEELRWNDARVRGLLADAVPPAG